jgi:hypothetical protein
MWKRFLTLPFGGPVGGGGHPTRGRMVDRNTPGGVPQGPAFFVVLDIAKPNGRARTPELSGCDGCVRLWWCVQRPRYLVTGDRSGTGASRAGTYPSGSWNLDSAAPMFTTRSQFGVSPVTPGVKWWFYCVSK